MIAVNIRSHFGSSHFGSRFFSVPSWRGFVPFFSYLAPRGSKTHTRKSSLADRCGQGRAQSRQRPKSLNSLVVPYSSRLAVRPAPALGQPGIALSASSSSPLVCCFLSRLFASARRPCLQSAIEPALKLRSRTERQHAGAPRQQ